MKSILFMCLALLMLSLPAQAAAPDKSTLIAFWEQNLKESPNTVALKPTAEKNVYAFETTFFPYKGRLKLLNAAVTGSGTEGYAGLYTGIIEVELLDASRDFIQKYAQSYYAWQGENRFYYNEKTGKWFPAGKWGENYNAEDSGAYRSSASSCKRIGNYIAVIIPLSVLALLIFLIRRQARRAYAVQDDIVARQKRILEISEESLAVQKQMLETLRKK